MKNEMPKFQILGLYYIIENEKISTYRCISMIYSESGEHIDFLFRNIIDKNSTYYVSYYFDKGKIIYSGNNKIYMTIKEALDAILESNESKYDILNKQLKDTKEKIIKIKERIIKETETYD